MGQEVESLGLPIPKNRFSSAKQYHDWVDKIHKKGLGHYTFVQNILAEFGLDPKNPTYQLGLVWKIFFNKLEAPIKPTTRLKQDSGSLWIKIEPWTTKKDLEDFWPAIEALQKELSGYRGKENPWETFERDFHLYILYLEAKKEGSKSIYTKIASYPKFGYLENKYNLDEDNIRSIVSRCNKYFSHLNLL